MSSASPEGGGGWRRWLRAAAGLAVLALAAGVASQLLREPPSAASPDVTPLSPWEMVGCYRLRTGAWSVAWSGDGAGGDRGGGDGDPGRPPPARAAPRSGAAEVAPGLEPPGRVMLLADSMDRWGRALSSRRAVALSGDRRRGRALRWLVSADTLWLVWSDGDVRAGVALRPSGDSLAGRVRSVRGGGDVDATAPASARRINCWTLRPSRPSPRRGR